LTTTAGHCLMRLCRRCVGFRSRWFWPTLHDWTRGSAPWRSSQPTCTPTELHAYTHHPIQCVTGRAKI